LDEEVVKEEEAGESEALLRESVFQVAPHHVLHALQLRRVERGAEAASLERIELVVRQNPIPTRQESGSAQGATLGNIQR
jgi:hypothetical protein